MSFETPPPYGDDRENLPPVPPELETPSEPLPPKSNTFRNSLLTSLAVHVALGFIAIGFLIAPISILVGLIGMAAAKDEQSRARMGGIAAGAGTALLVGAGLCIALLSGAMSAG